MRAGAHGRASPGRQSSGTLLPAVPGVFNNCAGTWHSSSSSRDCARVSTASPSVSATFTHPLTHPLTSRRLSHLDPDSPQPTTRDRALCTLFFSFLRSFALSSFLTNSFYTARQLLNLANLLGLRKLNESVPDDQCMGASLLATHPAAPPAPCRSMKQLSLFAALSSARGKPGPAHKRERNIVETRLAVSCVCANCRETAARNMSPRDLTRVDRTVAWGLADTMVHGRRRWLCPQFTHSHAA